MTPSDPGATQQLGRRSPAAYTVETVAEVPRKFAITGEGLVIGRASDSAASSPDVSLPRDSGASRRHARIFLEGGGCRIEDLGSKNGTFVNGRRVSGAQQLRAGDRVTVGSQDLLILDGHGSRVGEPGPPGETTVLTTYAAYARTVAGPIGGDRTTLQRLVDVDQLGVASDPQPVAYTGARLRIGRDPRNELVLANPNVSRFHATIEPGPDGPRLRDLNSRNGTRIAGAMIRMAALDVGAEIGVGPFRLTFTGSEVRAYSEQGIVSIEAVGITVAGHGRQILAPTYLKIRPGELVGIIGENGAGKTTLLKALAGACPVAEGKVLVNGEPLTQRLTDVGYVPQDDTIHRWLTVEEALRYGARLRLPDQTAAEIDEAVESVIRQLGLNEKPGPDEPPLRARFIGSDELPTPGKLSGGQRKRTCVAMEMLARPSVVFLDEPTSPLDPLYAEELIKLLRGLALGSCAVVIVTHKTDDVALCDKIAVMARGGYLTFYGPPAEALRFFGVVGYKDIYSALQRRSGPEWAERAGGEVARFRSDAAPPDQPRLTPRRRGSLRSQTGILARRQAVLLRRDRSNLLGLTLSVPIIAMFLLAFHKNVLHTGRGPTFLFVLVFVLILLGVIASFREVVKERPVFTRERAVGVAVRAYLASKLLVLGLVGAMQAVTLGILAFAFHPLYEGTGVYIAALLVLVLASIAGVAVGLTVSALAKSQEQATTFIAIPLVLQLLFAGAMIPLTDVETPSLLMPARWAFGALGRVAGMESRFPAPNEFHPAFTTSTVLDVAVLVLFPVALGLFIWWRLARSRS
jgi:ABC-type multidrug transport system ATPase subunit/pSer/pThr/pTyr-binding forkhead associated (FHA) protein